MSAPLTAPGTVYAGGRWFTRTSGDAEPVIDPATEQPWAQSPICDTEGVDLAVRTAAAAQHEWASTTIAERAAALRSLAARLTRHSHVLAEAITREMGAPDAFARKVQVGLPAMALSAFADTTAEAIASHWIENNEVVADPIGVVGAITPWNYPLYQAMLKVGAALAAGCTVVLKPASQTPVSTWMLADIIESAGLPQGVVNFVLGDATTGAALASHPDVAAVSFTGSTRGGTEVARQAVGSMKRVSLELGGKSACVALPDADIADVARRTAENVLENCGQTCSALSRLILPAGQLDVAFEAIADVFATQRIGPGSDPDTTVGPLASRAQLTHVQRFLPEGDSAKVSVFSSARLPKTGYFTRPAAFGGVNPFSPLAQEEIFGPVLTVLTYDHIDQAVEIANNTKYGLSGAVWSADTDAAVAVARRIRSGQVAVNGGAFHPAAPFGGHKQSGIGRELGAHGIREFLETKVIRH